jgi:uncharacterized protein (TIGR02145 family)
MSLITLPEKWGVRFCFWMLIILVIQGCKPKDPDPQIVIDTGELSEIGPTHCIIEGEILETGVNEILQHGFVWSESPDVTLDSGKKNELGTSGPGTYSSTIQDLSPNTTYYIRAYASDATLTKYGAEKNFITTGPTVPVLRTWSAFNVGSYKAQSGGNISSDGGSEVTARDVCWSTSRFPTIDDQFSLDDAGTGSYESLLQPLKPYTIYHTRAYATNSIGTGYGEEMLFFTLWDNKSVEDYDGNAYETVQIGDQVWIAENLRSEHYSDGSAMVPVEQDVDWMALEPDMKAYSYYENSTDNQDTYGMLYTWAAAMNGEGSSNELPSGIQGVCPSSWHMPSESEWKELEYQLGMSELIAVDVGWRGYEEGGMLKQKGTNLWKEPNLMATNETGFTALPGGFRDADGLFRAIESFTAFWSSTANEEGAWLRGLHYDRGEILHEPYQVKYGLSVRCVKDR